MHTNFRMTKGDAATLKRLALLWLACAAIGFALAAFVAVMLAVAVDHGSAWRAAGVVVAAGAVHSAAPRNNAAPATPVDTGRRLLGG